MKESAQSAPHSKDAEDSTLQRPANVALTPASDEFATTLHPSSRTPSHGGVARGAPAWNLPQADRERYLLHGVVAEGGHGRILRAQDLHLERMVALKEPISPGTSTEDRFLREARITARLQHPSIVPVYEAGRWPGGEPFYAMKLVSGRSLAYLIESMRTLSERLAALPHVLAVTEAMAYAHSQHVVHRDLKPSNILVGEFGETVVIDWGLAKELDRLEEPSAEHGATPPGSPEPEHTQLGTVMGTPAYMPPEQAAGQPVDERADVYALGAILYHLLSGKAPYTGASSQEVLQRVLNEEPTPLARLQPRLTEELLDIVSRAMARAPERRYASARELAEDLRRFQTGQLVGAHRYTRWERMKRFARRNRTALIVGAVAVVALLVGEAFDHQHIRAERDRAEQKQAAAERAEREALQRADELSLMDARNAVAQSPTRVLSRLASLSPTFAEWGRARTLMADALAQGVPTTLRDHTNSLNGIDLSPDERWLVSSSDDRTVRLWELGTGKSRVLETYDDEAWKGRFSPDGRYVASASKNGQVRLQELATGHSRLMKGHLHSVVSLEFARDGRTLISAGRDGQLWQWDVAAGTGRQLGTPEDLVVSVGLMPDGRHLLSSESREPALRLWNLEDGSSRLLLRPPRALTLVSVAPRAGAFAAGNAQGQLFVWTSPDKPYRTLESEKSPLRALALSPDGRYLAAQHSAGTVYLWDLVKGTQQSLAGSPGWWGTLAFSADGRWLAAGSREGKVRVWEVASAHLRVLHGALGAISSLTFNRDGKWLIAGSHDGKLRLHELEDRSTRILSRHVGPALTSHEALDSPLMPAPKALTLLGNRVAALLPTSDGRDVLSVGGRDGLVRRSSLEGSSVRETLAHADGLTAAVALPDGTRLVTAAPDGTVELWDGQGQRLQRLVGPAQRIRALALSGNGARVAAGDSSGELWLWETASGQGRVLSKDDGSLSALAFSPDGRLLASGGSQGALRLWDLTSGTSREVHRHQLEVSAVAFSPEGRILASGSIDHTAWLQPLEAGAGKLLELGASGVKELRFSPDGQELFTASMGDPTVRRWDARTGHFLSYLEGHQDSVLQVAFSPEGQRMATASMDGTIRVWDLKSGEGRTLRGHEDAVLRVAFTRDGRHVLSAGYDGTVRLWRDDLPLEPEALRAWLRQQAAE
ncbi:MAG: serine/threonine protein kinase [Myxococcaceae bacterium]|nr:serine/threonine protein kinase [Myxococcaceae bacterium]